MSSSTTTAPRRARRLVQVGGFVRKEIVAVARQPRLLLVLVVGPFVILLLFGLGYDQEQSVLRTAFVGPPGSIYEDSLEQFTDELEQYVENAGYSDDLAAAEARAARWRHRRDRRLSHRPDRRRPCRGTGRHQGPPRQDRPHPASGRRGLLAGGRDGDERAASSKRSSVGHRTRSSPSPSRSSSPAGRSTRSRRRSNSPIPIRSPRRSPNSSSRPTTSTPSPARRPNSPRASAPTRRPPHR